MSQLKETSQVNNSGNKGDVALQGAQSLASKGSVVGTLKVCFQGEQKPQQILSQVLAGWHTRVRKEGVQ